MGLKIRIAPLALGLIAVSPALFAAPKLRLTTTAVGPVSIGAGQNGPAQRVEAYNAGDGSLNLQLSTPATWLAASAGSPTLCTQRPGTCTPVNLTLNTASLPKGSYTTAVTISDPAALDAPQTVTVTVNMGGGLPASVELTVAPNKSASVPFSSNSNLVLNATTQSGGNWLSVPLEDGGTFRFVYNYKVVVTPGGLGDGVYSGQVQAGGSALADENKAIPVTLRVTSQPIAQPSSERVKFKLVQGSEGDVANLLVSNRGLGTLSVTSSEAVTTTGGDWLKITNPVATNKAFVQVAASAAALAPGTYSGEVRFVTNAVNANVSVPVDLEVMATGAGAPVAFFKGAVNNATFAGGDVLAPGSIVSLFGELLTAKLPAKFAAAPLPTTLGGARILVNGKQAPLYYASPGQVNFQLPFDTVVGEAEIQAERDGVTSNKITVMVENRAPRILRFNIGEYGIVTFGNGVTYPLPTSLGLPGRPAKTGDALIIYLIDFGPTAPPVESGAASPGGPLAEVPGDTIVYFGPTTLSEGIAARAFFSGLSPSYVGLYQVNVYVPEGVPTGDNVVIQVGNSGARSNKVQIAIQ